MRAVRITDAGLALSDVNEPSGDGLVVDVAASSICGTDVGLVAMGAQGFTLGHEFAGTIAGSIDGTAFAVEPTIYCGACEECAGGHTQRCRGPLGNLGIFTDGGLADQALVPPYSLVPLPPDLDVQAACLVEPAAVAWHAIQRAALQSGQRSVVVGGGSIGLLTVAWLRAGRHEVDLEARYRHQIAAGERLGAGPPHGEYDVVFDAAGTDTGLLRCTELARPGARIVLLGVHYGLVPLPGVPVLLKELTCVAAMAYGRHQGGREVEEAAAMLASHPDVADTLITHRFPLVDTIEAFRVAADRASGSIKVVLLPG